MNLLALEDWTLEDDGEVAEPAADASPGDTAEAAVSGGDAAAGEDAPPEGPGGEDAPPEGDDASPEAAPGDGVLDWNGEVDSLGTLEWYQTLPPGVQQALLDGLKAKVGNFHRKYTESYESNAEQTKRLEAKAKEVRESEIRVQRWLNGDVDPMVELQEEMNQLKTGHEQALAELRQAHETALEEMKTGSSTEVQKAQQELVKAKEQLEMYELQKRVAEQEALAKATNEMQTWIEQEAAYLFGNDDAFYQFTVLLSGGVDKVKALQMVQAVYPDPSPKAEEPSDSLDLMNMGGKGEATDAGDARSFREMMDALRRAAQQEEGGLMG